MSEDRSPEKAKGDSNKTESFEKQQETIAALREQLAQANERDMENKHIIATLTQLGQAGLLFIYTGMGTWVVAVIVVSVILVIREIHPDRAVECFSNFGLPGFLVVASVMFSGFGYWVLRRVSTNHPGS
jgi:hypothetical protein